eukprot:7318895-Prymnesium_polylepis.1
MGPSWDVIKCSVKGTDLSTSTVLNSLHREPGFTAADGWELKMWERALILESRGKEIIAVHKRPYLIHTETLAVVTVQIKGASCKATQLCTHPTQKSNLDQSHMWACVRHSLDGHAWYGDVDRCAARAAGAPRHGASLYGVGQLRPAQDCGGQGGAGTQQHYGRGIAAQDD